jgi:hypothetical protein
MITRSEFLSLNFVKKEDFTGSHKGLRFLLRQEAVEDEKKLRVFIWSEPLGFAATPDEEKKSELFEFSEEGLLAAIAWMNANYEEVRYKNKE